MAWQNLEDDLSELFSEFDERSHETLQRFCEARQAYFREYMRQRRKDTWYRDKEKRERNARQQRMQSDPLLYERQKQKQHAYYQCVIKPRLQNDPALREERREKAKARYQAKYETDPAFRARIAARQLAYYHAVLKPKYQTNPAYRLTVQARKKASYERTRAKLRNA